MSRYGLEIEQEALAEELVGGADIKIKKCSKCGFEGEKSLFISNGNCCKKCNNEYAKQWRDLNKERLRKYKDIYDKEYYKNNKEKIKASSVNYRRTHKEEKARKDKEYLENNKERVITRRKKYYKENAEKIKDNSKKYKNDNLEYYSKYAKEYSKNNKEKVAKTKKDYYNANKSKISKWSVNYREKNKERLKEYRKINRENIKNHERDLYANNKNFKLAKILRTRLKVQLGKTKGGSFVKDLGCSIDELKLHLEYLFWPGMTWDNWGRKRKDENGYFWEIDHIVSLCFVDLEDRSDFLKVCHYSNLRPCWRWANMARNFYSDEEIDFNSPIPKYFIKEEENK